MACFCCCLDFTVLLTWFNCCLDFTVVWILLFSLFYCCLDFTVLFILLLSWFYCFLYSTVVLISLKESSMFNDFLTCCIHRNATALLYNTVMTAQLIYLFSFQMPNKLAFKVTHASGQDEVHRASELNYHSPLTKGWQAAR